MRIAEYPDVVERAARRIEAETGLQFGAARRRDLENGLRRMAAVCRDAGAGAADVAAWLLDGPWNQDKADLCAHHLTVGETYFFREPRGFTLLCDYARARLAADPRAGLRLWSAGCCTGEEPYSMAIVLREALPGLASEQVSILGTDLNPASLSHAREGLYRQWSFRGTDPELRARYFSPAGTGQFALAPAIRDQVRFAPLNLALAQYPSAANGTAGMDIIFCRNVMMYFSRSLMAQVIARLRACLADGGWLVVNPSEACGELFAGFSPTYYPDAVFYQKTEAAVPAIPPCAPSAPPKLRPLVPARLPALRHPVSCEAAPLQAAPLAAPPAEEGPGAALAQADALDRAGAGSAALNCLARAANQWPLARELHQAAARLALDQGQPAAARRHLQRLLYLDPDSVMGHYFDGVAQASLERRAGARRAFSQVAALLAPLPDDAPVEDAAGWRAGALRLSVGAWLERIA